MILPICVSIYIHLFVFVFVWCYFHLVQVQNMVNILRESRMIGPGGLSLVDIIAW